MVQRGFASDFVYSGAQDMLDIGEVLFFHYFRAIPIRICFREGVSAVVPVCSTLLKSRAEFAILVGRLRLGILRERGFFWISSIILNVLALFAAN